MRLARPRSGERASCGVRSASSSVSILRSISSRQLEPVGAEQFDAVVLEEVVRGGDHHAEIAAHRTRQHRHRRRRHRPQQQHVHADRGEAGDQRIFDHVAGKPGVLADDDAMAMFAALKHQPGGLADFQREFRRDLAVGAAADAVGAEILAPHVLMFSARSVQPPRITHFTAKILQKSLQSLNVLDSCGTTASRNSTIGIGKTGAIMIGMVVAFAAIVARCCLRRA